jgi:hypothetical protein
MGCLVSINISHEQLDQILIQSIAQGPAHFRRGTIGDIEDP